MNANQIVIKECIARCFSAMERYDRAVKTFGAEKARVVAQPWTQEEQERQISKARSVLGEAAQRSYDDISKELATIRAAAVKMEQAFDISPELQASIALVSAVGDKLPMDTRLNIIKSFTGNKQALVALQGLFVSKGIETKEVTKYIFDASSRCDKLDLTAHRLTIQPGTDIGIILTIAKELEDFAELEGVELTQPFAGMIDTAAYMTARLRESMGLPPA